MKEQWAARTLREELERQVDDVIVSDQPLQPAYEIASTVYGSNQPHHFRAVQPMPVVINTLATRELVSKSFGTTELASRYAQALKNPVRPVEVEHAPVQEVVHTEFDLLTDLPILTHYEGESDPYITTGVVIGETRDGSSRNLSYHRMQIRGPKKSGIVIVDRHLRRILESSSEPLPVVVVLGLDGATRFAAAASGAAVPYGFDELGIAGALHGQPVPLVRGVTQPVWVPAEAEIAIEGYVDPAEWEEEGPFAEFDGTYEGESAHVFHATGLTHRKDAMYQGLLSGSDEQLNIMGLMNEGILYSAVQRVLPGVVDVHVTRGGLRKFHAVVSIDKHQSADGKDAIIAAFAGYRDLKHVVIVDGDINPADLQAVEQQIATFFQADKDLVLIHGGRGNPVDRSLSEDGQTSRMGLDATRPMGFEQHEHAKVKPLPA